MTIDKETLEKIAHLARLKFNGAAEKGMLKDMNNMLDFVEKLREVNTAGVEPLQHMSLEINQLRDDVAGKHLDREKALKLAPSTNGEHFIVPKVIE